jgi:hypothetical protein
MRPTNPSVFTYEDKLPTALTQALVNPGVHLTLSYCYSESQTAMTEA